MSDDALNPAATTAAKRVNLLPEWYRREDRQRKHLRVHLGLMIVLGAVMVAARQAGEIHLGGLKRENAELQAQAKFVRDLAPQLEEKTAELERLTARQLACRELGATVPMSTLIQQILNDAGTGGHAVAGAHRGAERIHQGERLRGGFQESAEVPRCGAPDGGGGGAEGHAGQLDNHPDEHAR